MMNKPEIGDIWRYPYLWHWQARQGETEGRKHRPTALAAVLPMNAETTRLYAVSDIAAAMQRELSSLGPARGNIIRKGMIYSTDHGYLDFTVPLFAEFMRRQMDNG